MIVAKAVNMAEAMKVPVLGLVENMAYFVCPNCNEKHYLFGESQVDVLAQEYEIGATAQIPHESYHCHAVRCGQGRSGGFFVA